MRAPAIAAILLLLGAAPGWADERNAIPGATILHLNQVAERTVPRDRLTIELRTEVTGTDARQVQAEVNRRMSAALAKARSVQAVKAVTGNYETYQFTPTGPDGKPKPPIQWRTMQVLIVTSRDFNAALGLAGQLQDGGLLMSDMHFEVAPDTLRAQEQVLTDEALTQLSARARQIAANLGLTVARIQALNVGNVSQPGGGFRPMMAARASGVPAPAPPPVAAAGDTQISVSVNAEIALTPSR